LSTPRLTLELLGSIEAVRDLLPRYLDSLRGPQEAWLQEQLFARRVGVIRIYDGTTDAGYAVSDPAKGLLLQFFVRREHLSLAEPAFLRVKTEARIRQAFATTRDPVALGLCLSHKKAVHLESFLFEECRPPDGEPAFPDEHSFRPASAEDVARIRGVCGEFFPEPERDAEAGCLHLLEKGTRLLGVGYVSDRFCSPGSANVGMFVAGAYRRRGVATEVLVRLRRLCADRGLAPIAACHHENGASRGALAKAGFVSADRTFLFHL
jgi:GNAT superfamily N-acetyltransferase